MAPIAVLLRRCIDGFKTAVTAQSFGMEYELLCTELSLQWVRIQVWGEAAGLNLATSENIEDSLLYRPDIEPTISQTIDCMISLLTEIEHLRHKYQSKLPPSTPRVLSVNDTKSPTAYEALGTQGTPRNKLTLQQRVIHHQKKKSIFAKAKWALRDARRFDDKLRRLKGYVDALESITKAVDFTTYQPPKRSVSTTDTHVENPPPYSAALSPASNADSEELGHPPSPAPYASIIHQSMATRRYGCIFPPGFNMCHHGYCLCSQRFSGSHGPPKTPRVSLREPSTSARSSCGTTGFFKTFRVAMDDTTRTILPVALLKWNIDAPWQEYALYISYGDQERCLGLGEKPLVLYKRMQREGKQPMFMLRKISNMEAHARRSYNETQLMDSVSRGEYDGNLGEFLK